MKTFTHHVVGSPLRVTSQTENLFAFSKWRVIILDPGRDHGEAWVTTISDTSLVFRVIQKRIGAHTS